jgi:outer membrane protein
MKKLFKVALVAICIVFTGSFAKAQTKIGYINTEEVLQSMPETKTIKTQIDAYSKQFQDRLDLLNKEYQDKFGAYQKGQSTMTDATRIAAQGELADIQKRTQDYNNTATESVNAKVQELLKPINDKIHVAIVAVAKEKGFTYVINTANTELLVAPETDSLLPAVKVKLGLTGATAPAAAAPAIK